MTDVEILGFDSDLFGFGVAKILPKRLSSEALSHILNELKGRNIKLVYWLTDSQDVQTQKASAKAGGVLVDHKATFVVNLASLDFRILSEARKKVEEYPYPEINHEMKKLSEQIGAFSRFGMDPHMPTPLMKKMYHAWISNSIKGVAATRVFVVHHGTKIVGMVTLGQKNKRGDIGLIAVSEKFHGQGLGKLLVHAAQAQFIAEGFSEAQVVTQRDNKAACKLYEKTGFRLERIENFYHFWL